MPRFALVSDLHCPDMPRVPARWLLGKRVLGYVSWHRKRKRRHRASVLTALIDDVRAQAPDHVLVAGDLTNLAVTAETPLATAWLRRFGAPDAVSAVPGNHDAYGRGAPVPHRVWAPWMTDDAGTAGFPYVRRRDGVALIGLSTAVVTPPFMASGRLGGAQLDGLASALDAAGAAGLVRVVLLHHPPRRDAASRRVGLADARALETVLAAHGAELVAHGHLHRDVHTHLAGRTGPIPVVSVPAASACAEGPHPPAGYALLDLPAAAGHPSGVLTRRRLTADGSGFESAAPVPLACTA